jgi:DNA-binding PadR family transcriptional regulator/polyisoprenoid-binding protein YceI
VAIDTSDPQDEDRACMATEQRLGEPSATDGVARFELAPPRRFMLPAILLLLSEQPGYGYGLVPRLVEFRFGHVDRPAVYRALAQLERDGLVQVSAPDHPNGQGRRVYSVTPLGERVLRVWMGVVREEHAHLGEVIRRYQATATIDSVLSEVEGGWVPELDLAWSPVSTTSMWRRRLMPPESESDDAASHSADLSGGSPGSDRSNPSSGLPGDFASQPDADLARPEDLPRTPTIGRFVLDPERSAVLIDARSTVGPICFGTTGVQGALNAAMGDAGVNTEVPPSGWLTIDMTRLSSGNKLYDAELHRRINSRRFPSARVELKECTPSAPGRRYRLRGELTFHGITRRTEGTVRMESASDDRIVISGEQAFDIRDFALPSPTMLMLRIFPDVRVRLYAEAERSDDD